jgi:signal peptidase I
MTSVLLFWLYLSGNLIFLLVILGICARLACKVVVIQGESMQPTLIDGDHILVLDWWSERFLRNGQIIMSKTLLMVNREFHVKRIIATAGEIVAIPISAIPNTDGPQDLIYYYDECGMRNWQIPSRHVFLCGDNPMKSFDSRFYGPLPYEHIQGIVLMKFPCTLLFFSTRRG